MTVAAAVAVVAPAGREGKHWTYDGAGEESHRRETIAAAAAAAATCHRRETGSAAAVAAAAAACHRRETSVAVDTTAAEACHHRETVAAAAAAEACHHREIPYGILSVGLRLPRLSRPENHDRRQEHGDLMDVPGTGGE